MDQILHLLLKNNKIEAFEWELLYVMKNKSYAMSMY